MAEIGKSLNGVCVWMGACIDLLEIPDYASPVLSVFQYVGMLCLCVPLVHNLGASLPKNKLL